MVVASYFLPTHAIVCSQTPETRALHQGQYVDVVPKTKKKKALLWSMTLHGVHANGIQAAAYRACIPTCFLVPVRIYAADPRYPGGRARPPAHASTELLRV